MFNLQGSEIIVILLLALVVLGPEKLPDAIRRFTRTYNELKKMGSGFQSELKSALDEPMREMRETAEMVRDAADPDRIAATAETADTADTADTGRDVAKAGDPPLVEPAEDVDGAGDRAVGPVTADTDQDTRGTDPSVGHTEPVVAEGAAPTRVNQIAAANSSAAIAASASPDAAADADDPAATEGDGGAGAGDGTVAAVGPGPAFHSAAPRATTVVDDDVTSADDGSVDGGSVPLGPAGDVDADPVPVESSDETATA